VPYGEGIHAVLHQAVYLKCRKPAFDAHVEKCKEKPEVLSYTARITAAVGVAVQAAEESFAGTAATTVTLKVDSGADVLALQLRWADQEDLHALGLEYQGREDTDAGSYVIGITTSDDAFIAAFAAPGAVLRKAVEVAEGGRTFTAQDWMEHPNALPALLTFQLKPPPVPSRGWARKAPRRPGLKLKEEQEEFLISQWKKDEKITAYLLKENMDKEFHKRPELQLLEEDVQQWLAAWYSKQRRAKGKGKAEEGGEGWEQEGDEAV
jgi:hypothetical protein